VVLCLAYLGSLQHHRCFDDPWAPFDDCDTVSLQSGLLPYSLLQRPGTDRGRRVNLPGWPPPGSTQLCVYGIALISRWGDESTLLFLFQDIRIQHMRHQK
jgi:hypothetical protein